MQAYAFSTLSLAFALAWLNSTNFIWAKLAFTPHLNIQNSTTTITADQRKQAGISSGLAANVIVALEFERLNWANGSVAYDDFYHVPPGAAGAPAGALLKLQRNANTSAYTVPPNTAISRFMFQTKTLNGSTVPGSAYILWPFMPRNQPNGGGYPVIGWAHGTSGGFGNCAPSHIRNLWYQFTTPYTLVLQGYVVVAPDYAGLGVDKDSKHRAILHQYLANPSHANDIFYSVQAAQSAFKVLSKQFVVMGHSQGGGAAWGAAQRQALVPVEGYLGSVAGSPVTDLVDLLGAGSTGSLANAVTALIARALSSIFPDFNLSSILTPTGLKLLTLLSEIQGCNSVATELFVGSDIVQPNLSKNFYLQRYQNLTGNGGRPIAGPLLVIQGEADPAVPFLQTTRAINRTCELYPNSQLEYSTFAEVTHVLVMYASQRIWLKWIEDRFEGVTTPHGCSTNHYSSARPYHYYQKEVNWFIEFATEPYQIA
ncbi:hypothetical protein MMC31_004038 [Peltigera leucophlebia]|nr:hypothetical protein [Peltigera leucophlebia]